MVIGLSIGLYLLLGMVFLHVFESEEGDIVLWESMLILFFWLPMLIIGVILNEKEK